MQTTEAGGTPVERPVRPDPERAAFARWCRENGHGELDDMLTPLDRSLRALMWPVWQGAMAAGLERCAAWVDARRDAFCEEHGSIDPDTGTLEFGRGPHAAAKDEYVGELEEIAAGLRALKA